MFKKIAKLSLIVIAVLALAVLAFLAYMGVFQKVVIKTEHRGPYVMAYIEHVGAYSEITKPMIDFGRKLDKAGFDYSRSAGIYHSDPKNMPESQLRSEVGYIIAESDMGKIEANKDKFDFKTIEEGDYAVVEFPLRNRLSYIIGPQKAYAAFGKYFKETKYKFLIIFLYFLKCS